MEITRSQDVGLASDIKSLIEVLLVHEHDGAKEEKEVHAKFGVHVEEKGIGLDYSAELDESEVVVSVMMSRDCWQAMTKWYRPILNTPLPYQSQARDAKLKLGARNEASSACLLVDEVIHERLPKRWRQQMELARRNKLGQPIIQEWIRLTRLWTTMLIAPKYAVLSLSFPGQACNDVAPFAKKT